MLKRFVDLPPVWLLASAGVAWLLAQYLPLARLGLPDWLGWAIFALGLAWAASATVIFARKKTPVEPRKTPKVLLTTGAFRVNRNPIYTGMTVMLIGWALVLGAVTAFLPAIAFPFIITNRFVLKEEEELRAQFGPQAEEFFSRSRRW